MEGVQNLRDIEKKRKTDAEFDRSCFHYTLRVPENSGIPKAIKDYCGKTNTSVNALISQSIAEKLSAMDVHSLSIAEIEEIEREANEN